MSMNLSAKLDELQRGDRQLETTVALCEIRSQLQELTKSVESCQSEVSEVKRDMVAIKHELDTVQQVKEEIEELREYVDRLGEQSHRRKLRLLEQVCVQGPAKALRCRFLYAWQSVVSSVMLVDICMLDNTAHKKEVEKMCITAQNTSV